MSQMKLVAALAAAVALAACSSTNAFTTEDGGALGTPAPDGGADSGASEDGAADAAADVAVDVVDAGSDGAATSVFAGAGPYVAGSPGPGGPANTANAAHGGTVVGKNCMVGGCHLGGFGFGGTVFGPGASTTGVPGVEIRIVHGDGTTVVTYTDIDGNFWSPATAPVVSGARLGIRNATSSKERLSPVPNGACAAAGCHDGTMRIRLP